MSRTAATTTQQARRKQVRKNAESLSHFHVNVVFMLSGKVILTIISVVESDNVVFFKVPRKELILLLSCFIVFFVVLITVFFWEKQDICAIHSSEKSVFKMNMKERSIIP